MTPRVRFVSVCLACVFVASACGEGELTLYEEDSGSSTSAAVVSDGITLKGKLIWHSYTSYSFDEVRSWMANFDAGATYEITQPRLRGAMNYHFNADGTEVVFMSDDRDVAGDEWDVWVASVTASGLSNVTKITPTNGSRDEDPKFSSDGTRIIFKRNLNDIVSINRSAFTVNGTNQTPAQTTLLSDPAEIGMPYFMVGSNSDFVFSYGVRNDSSIRKVIGGTVSIAYDAANTQEYYPVALNSTEFYFAKGVSGSTPDQIYKGDLAGSAPVGAAFNTASAEVADACPVDAEWLFYSSTRSGGAGSYDLWLGNFNTGVTYNLDRWIAGSNHGNLDLGATFHGTISAGTTPTPTMTASASSVFQSYEPANAIDGNLSTLWSASSGAYPAWLQVDLGSNRTITNVKADFYPATAIAWKYQIQTSTDGTSFTTVVNRSTNKTRSSSVTHTLPSPVARYVRIYFPSAPSTRDWAALREFTVNSR